MLWDLAHIMTDVLPGRVSCRLSLFALSTLLRLLSAGKASCDCLGESAVLRATGRSKDAEIDKVSAP